MLLHQRSIDARVGPQLVTQLCAVLGLELLDPNSAAESFTNSAYLVQHPEWGSSYLKIYDPRFPPSHSSSESVAIAMARSLGVNVPDHCERSVLAVDGVDYATLVTSSVPGSTLLKDPATLSLGHVDQIVSVIRALHSHHSDQFGPITEQDNTYIVRTGYPEFIADVFQLALRKAGSRGMDAAVLYDLEINHQRGLSRLVDASTFVFSHKDITLKHCYFVPSINLPFVIDWEWALYLDSAYDFGVLIGSLISDGASSDVVNYATQRALQCGIDPGVLEFHLARELFFASVYRHRDGDDHPITNNELLQQAWQRMRNVQ